ncbi:DNA primase traC [Proteiniborus sp. DW1]|uniref:ArdC family protein n=1 Tax=Proteiniborus sp. DW1 TaxID=1889883 RepID=UPI00092DFD2C|nr:zincin-like metallopeptidase domain-containing protein [Proteiniborus sp. DW1]SCG83670.1 DNA primase traC [Proteiniborus sp. DW1]
MNKKTKEYRQKLADTFVKSLKENRLDWKKEWKGQSMIPINGTNNKRYKGINRFWLGFVSLEKGYTDPRWCTFNQIRNKGWRLNKGAKGEQVEYWMPYDFVKKKVITWAEFNVVKDNPEKIKNINFIAKYYVVFNAKDIVGIPPLPPIKINNIHPDEIIKRLSNNMGVEILNDGNDKAFYRPSEDKIHLPKPEYFTTDYAYNSTALHELAHSTGAKHRLNRNINNIFGSSDYAYEELIAEVTSCFMSVNLRTEQTEEHINNHKAYVQSWIQAISEKPETLIKAIREAEKIANYMEYKAELINEKDFLATQNESMEVKEVRVIEYEEDKYILENEEELEI